MKLVYIDVCLKVTNRSPKTKSDFLRIVKSKLRYKIIEGTSSVKQA